MKKIFFFILFLPLKNIAQLNWKNVDSLFQPLPNSVHVYYTNDSLDGKPNIAYYVIADLKDKQLNFTVDTTLNRRLTPTQYYQKNSQPLLVVNCTFFEFAHHKNLNTVIKNKKQIAFGLEAIAGKGKDTLTYRHAFNSAFGISKKRKADIAWLYTDSSKRKAFASQKSINSVKDSSSKHSIHYYRKYFSKNNSSANIQFSKWKMQTAIGGGPVLLQNGEIKISNKEELKFSSNTGLTDKHPRTCIGYTANDKLIILVIQGRFPKIAEGATLVQQAQILKNLGCIEAMNLDGGGSSCLLVNGKETIKPSDKEGQRAVPCVFMVKQN